MSAEQPIKVMLVDDHNVVRSGLGAFLMVYDDLDLVADASSGEEALRLCKQHQPDVILMDLVMPGMDGATTTEKVCEQCPDVKVLALTSLKDKELVQGALARLVICLRMSPRMSWPMRFVRRMPVSLPWLPRRLRP